MRDVVIALLPALVVSALLFGWSVLGVTALSVVCCVVFEYLIQRFMLRGAPTVGNLSAVVTGVLLAFNLPASIPWWIVVIGAFVAIAIGKMTFGGLGKNPFNPALVGRVFLLIAYPAQMTSFPQPAGAVADAFSGATPLAAVKFGAVSASAIDYQDMLFGSIPGSLGEVAALALLAGFVYLLWRRVITWHVPVTILATMALFAFFRGSRPRLDGQPALRVSRFPRAGGRRHSGCGLHGHRLLHLADDRARRCDLRRGDRRHHDVHPPVGRLSRGHVVCDSGDERHRAPYQSICQTQAFRRQKSRRTTMKSTLVNMVAVLFTITLVASAGVGYVNMITVGPIAEAKAAATQSALRAVLPSFDRTETTELTLDELPVAVHTARSGEAVVGYAVETASKNGFSGMIRMVVGFDATGRVLNVNVLEQNETPGLGTKMADEGNPLFASFEGRNPGEMKLAVKKDGGDVDALTAATISSRAYVDAMARAYAAYKQIAEGVAPAASDTASGATATGGDAEAAADSAAGATAQTGDNAQKGGDNE